MQETAALAYMLPQAINRPSAAREALREVSSIVVSAAEHFVKVTFALDCQWREWGRQGASPVLFLVVTDAGGDARLHIRAVSTVASLHAEDGLQRVIIPSQSA